MREEESAVSLRDTPKIDLHCHLEACNWLCNSVPSTGGHPVRRSMEAGVPVTINSDDPGLFGIDLCHEYAVLQREHGFTREDFARCNIVAVQQPPA